MVASTQLIIGLGNPGKEYAATRHNAGAWFVEKIVQEAGLTLRYENKFQGLYTATKLMGHPCHLLVPTTYMNLSGQAVRACAHYLKIHPEAMLVAHDDIDLSVADVRLKFDGGDGGHNGLKSIIQHLNTKKFYRLRIGVGRPTAQGRDIVDYVLHAPSQVERNQIKQKLETALHVLPLLLEGKSQQAMQQLHTRPDQDNQTPEK